MSLLPRHGAGRLLSRSVSAAMFLGAAPAALAQSSPPADAAASAPAAPSAVVERSGSRISVSGQVAAATAEAVKRHMSAPEGAEVDTLVIFSTGGDFDALIDLGRLIHARKMTVQVERVCAGPCAAFLAPAAERLVASRGSLLVFFPILTAQRQMAAQAAGTTDEKKFQDLFERQASYFRELGVDPDKAYAIGETALTVKAALAETGRSDQPLIVPDADYFRKCLGIGSVEMPDYTVADSSALAHVSQHTPIAFLIDGKIYYEGKALANYDPSCSAD